MPVAQYETHENIARIARSFHHRAEIPANHHIPMRSTNNAKYRPLEIPANHHIIDGAGDAGGILPSLAVLDPGLYT
jgi:hypothetical protein